uniref:ISXO2-like transposase domain-containing protein n=1 Tax=Octopus bimaculoides TaxID=37653 RepID=A0A0L8I0A4_OCTBM
MTSIKFCKSKLQMKANCVVQWNNYLREVCAAHILANSRVIGGHSMTAEIDENMCTKRKKLRWTSTTSTMGFRRSATTLLPMIDDNRRPGTTIISEECSAYKNIINIGHFKHLNHSLYFVNPTNGAHTQNTERLWKSAKEKYKRQNGTHRGYVVTKD